MLGPVLLLALVSLARSPDAGSPEDRALGYLAREVPRWSGEHRCFSCHNNGDAARSLYAAIRLGREVSPVATADTDRWLARPEGWDKNGGDGPFSDKALARIQFASALASAVASGRVRDEGALIRAAGRMGDDQAEDGSWRIGEPGQVGSPAAYGRPLATWMAREAMKAADPLRFRTRIGHADAWLRRLEPATVLDASTLLLAFPGDEPVAFALLRRGRSKEGGWGPFVQSSPEVFDTALALLALDRHRDRPEVGGWIEAGRNYLIAAQQEDGSWSETTRPGGAESYAQRISTTGWATLALLTVKPR